MSDPRSPHPSGGPPYPITSTTAASPKTPHTLTVVRSHLPFAADASRLWHEHGPLDWTPEVAHLIGPGREPDRVRQTVPVRSPARRTTSADLHRPDVAPLVPGWYPVFPRVPFVLTGASRARLDDRISDLQAMVAQHPLVAALAREVQLGAGVLEDIEEHGPSGSAGCR